MIEKNFSPLGIELRAGSVDPSLPLLYQIGVADGTGSEVQIIYVGMSREGAKAPFANYDNNLQRMREGRPPRNGGERFRPIHRKLDIAIREGKSIVIELVRNVDTDTEPLTAAKKALQREHGLKD